MNVTVEENVARLQRLTHHHFCCAVLGALLHARRNPLTIEIVTAERGTVVADDYTVWVQHGNDLEHEVVTQVLGVVIITDEELQNTLDNETCV